MSTAWNVPGLPFTVSPSSEAAWTVAQQRALECGCVQIRKLHLELRPALLLRSLLRHAGGWKRHRRRSFQRAIAEFHRIPAKIAVRDMECGCINDDVAGKIIGLPVGVMHRDRSGESVATADLGQVVRGIHRGRLGGVRRRKIGRQCTAGCYLLDRHPWPSRSQVHRDGLAGKSRERFRPRNARDSRKVSGTRETRLAARRNLVSGK